MKTQKIWTALGGIALSCLFLYQLSKNRIDSGKKRELNEILAKRLDALETYLVEMEAVSG